MKISLTLVLFICNLAASAQEARVFSAVGGSRKDNYFSEGIAHFKEAFESMGVPGKKQSLYFGGSDRDGRCISTYPDTVDGKSVTQYRQSIVDANSCDDFRITLALRFLTGINLPKDEDCSTLIDENVKEADANTLLKDLNNENFKNGEIVYIHLADHGGDDTHGDNDWVINMSNGDSVKSESFKEVIKTIVKKDAKVQMSFDACYSGGFTDAIFRLKSELKAEGLNVGRQLCSSSSTESKYAGYDSDPLLKAGYSGAYFKAMKKYGNQLSAVACAAGADSINMPLTTLDRFIDDEKNLRVEVEEEACFIDFYQDQKSGLDIFINSMLDISLKLKINLLVQDFHDYFGKVMVECYEEMEDDQTIVRMIDQCLPNDHQYAYLLKPFLKEAGNGKLHDQSLIKKHVSAIKSIKDSKELADYLDEFCCLAMPLDKSKSGPKSCDL